MPRCPMSSANGWEITLQNIAGPMQPDNRCRAAAQQDSQFERGMVRCRGPRGGAVHVVDAERVVVPWATVGSLPALSVHSCARPLPSPSRATHGATMSDVNEIDWRGPSGVERVPGRCSGAWMVKNACTLVHGAIDNAEDWTPEAIAGEVYQRLGADRARRIIEYARSHVIHHAPHA